MNNVERELTFRCTNLTKITKGLEHRARIHQDSPTPFQNKNIPKNFSTRIYADPDSKHPENIPNKKSEGHHIIRQCTNRPLKWL